MNWIPFAEEKQSRYEHPHGDLDERGLVRQGNAAYAAGLGLLMADDPAAAEWFRRAAARWRESWDAADGRESWGRPIGALKASLLAGGDDAVAGYARWTLELGCTTAESPIGRYAATLALLALGRWAEARHLAESLRSRDDFPHDVADALASIAAHDVIGYCEAVESVVSSFEDARGLPRGGRCRRHGARAAALAHRRDIDEPLPASPLLPPQLQEG